MNRFVPLETFRGLPLEQVQAAVGDRELYVWGCGFLGQTIVRSYSRNGLAVASFCDSGFDKVSGTVAGLPVADPRVAIAAAVRRQAFIIIAATNYRSEMEQACVEAGLEKNADFLTYLQLRRPEACVDISGDGTLNCPACPQHNLERTRPGGSMSFEVYEQVLAKLLDEIPDLSCVDLSMWGDPLLNPDCARAIAATERRLPCKLSTGLRVRGAVEEVARAGPSQLTILVDGFEASYETRHGQGSWDCLIRNIDTLRQSLNASRPGTQVVVSYQLYADDKLGDRERVKDLSDRSGFKFITSWAYPSPFETLADHFEGRPIAAGAREVLERLSWSAEHCSRLALAQAHRPCLCQRIFPIVNWDASVLLCHLYYSQEVAGNYLQKPLPELVEARHQHHNCRKCQRLGLHRLDIDDLLKHYPTEEVILPARGQRS